MRLHVLSHGHAPLEQKKLDAVRARSKREPLDMLKAMYYRPELWGRAMSELLQEAMRGPSEWSVGDRELIAAFTSNLNACRF